MKLNCYKVQMLLFDSKNNVKRTEIISYSDNMPKAVAMAVEGVLEKNELIPKCVKLMITDVELCNRKYVEAEETIEYEREEWL